MNFKKHIVIAALSMFNCSIHIQLSAQTKKNKFKAFPFPIIYYTPETRLAYGLAGNATFHLTKDSTRSRTSSILAGVAGTQNKQFLLYSQFNIFSDKYYFSGEAGYYKYSYFFYGTGSKEVPEELFSVNYPRIKINVAYRFTPNLYAGPSFQYEQYNIKKTADNGELAKGTIPGSAGSIITGAGLHFIYDNRDNVLYPGKGYLLNVSFIRNGKFLGGNYNFSKYTIDATLYKKLTAKSILAANSFNSFTTGNVPFQQLSQIGGSKIMRGYYQGRYTDKNLSAVQTELRSVIYKRFGVALFGGVAIIGSGSPVLDFTNLYKNYGAGLRFTLNRKEHLNLRLDYAFGRQSRGFYLSFGEAF